MKIAYLILAHTDPPQLQRLVGSLDDDRSTFFIHIDRKADVRPFTARLGREPNVRFLQERIKVHHGAFSIVQATLRLMEAASRAGGFDYFVLLSGSDYPIKSNRFIQEYFVGRQGREFIRYVNVLDTPFLVDKIETMRFHDLPTLERMSRAVRRIAGGLDPGKLASRVLRRRFPDRFVPYFGSQWWAVTGNCANYILRFAEQNGAFVDFFRFTYAPDEMFFHTVIMNSEFGARTNQTVEYVRWPGQVQEAREAGDTIKYVDWSLGREWPAILDERDFEALARSPRLFARKFSTSRSLRLIEQINRDLLRC